MSVPQSTRVCMHKQYVYILAFIDVHISLYKTIATTYFLCADLPLHSRVLLEAKADPRVKDQTGQNALRYYGSTRDLVSTSSDHPDIYLLIFINQLQTEH